MRITVALFYSSFDAEAFVKRVPKQVARDKGITVFRLEEFDLRCLFPVSDPVTRVGAINGVSEQRINEHILTEAVVSLAIDIGYRLSSSKCLHRRVRGVSCLISAVVRRVETSEQTVRRTERRIRNGATLSIQSLNTCAHN